MSLILASSSPRRQELIGKLGYSSLKICSPDVDETSLKGENARHYVARIACAKVNVVKQDCFIIAADTTVESGRQLLGKACNEEDARKNLERLSGRSHRVYTGVCVKLPNGKIIHRVVMTRLTFKKLSSYEIQAYLSSGEWHGAAGSYMIQGIAEAFVKRINGSYSNVVGLPLYETKCLLEGAGCYV